MRLNQNQSSTKTLILIALALIVFILGIKLISLLPLFDEETNAVKSAIYFLEKFVVYWLYLCLFIIFIYGIYLLHIERCSILRAINDHKIVYSFLVILFLTGTIIRFSFVSAFPLADERSYHTKAVEIALYKHFDYFNYFRDRDSPSFPVLASIFINLFNAGNKYILGYVNALFGSLSILLIFVLVQLLFKNHKISLVSSLLLTFNPLHLEYSTKGYPQVTSTFFCILTVVFLLRSIKTKSIFSYLVAGITLGFTAQMYYIELIMIMPVIIYTLLKHKVSFRTLLKIITVLIGLAISVLPFVILSNLSSDRIISSDSNDSIAGFLKQPICIWMPAKCNLVDFAGATSPDKVINHIDNSVLSYFGYLFLGIGSKSSYDTVWNYDGWLPYPNNYYLVNNNISFVYILSSIFIIISLFTIRHFWRELALLYSVLLIFVSSYSLYYDHPVFQMVPLIVLWLIPVVSYSLILFLTLIKRKAAKILIAILISLILISPFFSESMLNNLKMTKGSTMETEWAKIRQAFLSWDKEGCTNISFNRLKYECRSWIDIHNIVSNKSNCNVIEDKYFKERCIRLNNLYLQLNNIISQNTKLDLEIEWRLQPVCYNPSIFRLYCNSDKKDESYKIIDDCTKYNGSKKEDCIIARQIDQSLLYDNKGVCMQSPDVQRLCFIAKLFKIV